MTSSRHAPGTAFRKRQRRHGTGRVEVQVRSEDAPLDDIKLYRPRDTGRPVQLRAS